MNDIFDFLAQNSIYPMISTKGKVFFVSFKKITLDTEKAEDIITQLSLKTAEDCQRVREEVRKRASQLRDNLPIRKWVKEERPREMLVKDGADKLSLSKLFAIILRTGREGISAEELAKRLLNRFGTLRGIDSAPIPEIRKTDGIGMAKATQIKAALELGKRLYRESAKLQKKIKSPDEAMCYVAEYYGPYLRDAKKECFHIILLDVKNKPLDNIEISKGSIDASIVDPKEIIKEATWQSASSIILVHNHPSGETEPSAEDTKITNTIVDACKLVGIKVLDHIIIGKNKEDYYSFANKGLIK